MILTVKQIVDQIRKGNRVKMILYEGTPKDVTKVHRFETLDGGTPDELVGLWEDFAKEYPARWTVAMFTKTNATLDSDQSGVVMRVNAHAKGTQPVEVLSSGSGGLTWAAREKQLMDNIEGKLNLKMLELERDHLKSRVDEVETNGGKMSIIIESFFTRMFSGNTDQSQAALQGAEGSQSSANITDTETALGELLKMFGDDTIIKLAKKLNDPANAQMIAMVRQFANS